MKENKATGATVWVVGRVYEFPAWEFMGIYTERDKAIARCERNYDFVAPAKIDDYVSDEQILWPGLFFPFTRQCCKTLPTDRHAQNCATFRRAG